MIGQYEVAKSDYAALYTLMNAQGWVGQFNHPSTSQFAIGGTGMAYNANGANVMVLAEILNSSAFSTNTTETETSRSTYPGAFNLLLERGYKVAPSTDQDNHCANYGLSYRNRTGVLLPTGTALNEANFVTALRARRVFAAEDKNGQLILTANGNIMGGTYSNSGALTLTALHASTNGQTVQRVQFFEGVPGRNGTVTQLTEGSGSYTFTPAAGAHFYYALVTQANGDRFWSAPVWINQGSGGGDTTLPIASASVTGTSGTITLNASASDNVGVTSVEFLIDSVSRGSDTTSPYSLAFNSATLSNGTHSLVVKASDAAGNIGTSTAVSFTVSNTVSTTFTETESNGTAATGNVVGRSFTAIEGTMGNTTDKDFFAIALNANETLKVNITGGPTGSDYDLYLVDSADATLVSSTGGTSTETVSYANGASARTVYAKVISYAGSSTTVVYRLALTYTAGGSVAVEKVVNGGYESGASSWTDANSTITNSTSRPARTGSYKAWMCGYGAASNDTLYQTVTIPSTATEANYSFWTRIDTAETTTTSAYDTLRAEVRSSTGTLLTTLATYSNLNKSTSYVQRSFSLLAYKGQTVRLNFNCTEGSTLQTSFVIDDVSLLTR